MSRNNGIYLIIALIIIALLGYFAFAPRNDPYSGSGRGSKLDINAICEGALAYMTFPSGADADRFVAECKEGKHPDVIERYKQQMGIGEGVAY